MWSRIIKMLFIESLFRIEFKLINLEYNFEEIINIDNFNTLNFGQAHSLNNRKFYKFCHEMS